jgi:hypothetical protein
MFGVQRNGAGEEGLRGMRGDAPQQPAHSARHLDPLLISKHCSLVVPIPGPGPAFLQATATALWWSPYLVQGPPCCRLPPLLSGGHRTWSRARLAAGYHQCSLVVTVPGPGPAFLQATTSALCYPAGFSMKIYPVCIL